MAAGADATMIAKPQPRGPAAAPALLARARGLLGTAAADAAMLARQLLSARPESVEARFVLGAALRRDGQAEAACDVLRPLAAALPQLWGVQYELGCALAALGSDAAVEALDAAARLNPASPLAWQARADARLVRGDIADAAAGAGGDDPRLAAGAAALFDGRRAEAERFLVEGCGLHLNDPAALRLVADAGLRQGRGAAVAALLRGVLQAAPAFHAARHALAMALISLDLDEAAVAETTRLLAARPGNPGFAVLRGGILMRLGRADAAIADYDRALAARPDDAGAWHVRGHALRAAGDGAAAALAYRRALALRPEFGEAWWSLANLKTRQFDAADRALLAAAVEDRALDPVTRSYVGFALGKALEDEADHAAAFSHYAAANALRRNAEPHDAAAAAALADRAIATFDAAFFAGRAGSGEPGAGPIFIVGMPRAGSTLVEQMLASHSAIEGLSELPIVGQIARRLARDGAARGLDHAAALAARDPADFAALGREYLDRAQAFRQLDRRFFVDKFPGNFQHLALIRLMLPDARIVDVRRHPMACCWSLFKQAFADGQRYSYDLADLGQTYADYVRLMAHFDAVLPGGVVRVSYDALVAAPEAGIRYLLARLELPFEPGCLRFFETGRVIRTPSSEQVRQPIYRDAIDHWRHFEPHLGRLAAALGLLAHR